MPEERIGIGAACAADSVLSMRIASRWLLIACCAAAVALASLAWAAFRVAPLHHLDARVLAHLSSGRDGPIGDVAASIAVLGDPIPQALLLVAGLAIGLFHGRRRAALAALFVVLAANLTTLVLKHALATPRFDAVLGYAQVGAASFPSGHATAAFSMAAAWLLLVPSSWRRPIAAVGLTLASAVAVSVVVLGHHFPSDALGGLLVASVWAFAVLVVLRRRVDILRPPTPDPDQEPWP
jgi:membrane-associated phospholipid phosphatase